jgi:ammonium transporter, Amt family
MGGDISFESQPGVGSTFTITLPEVVTEPAPASDEGPEPHPERATILVIDDDPAARDLLRRTLERDGYGVVLAASGEEGLRLARSQPAPAAITLDVIMPGMDGWQVLSALKNDTTTATIPVIVLTMLDDTKLGFTLGASAFMTKPVDRERLTAVLRSEIGPSGAPVLIVDDDPAAREVTRRQLEAAGWSVEEAEDGRMALERIAARRPALIILDLMMPVLDGFAVVSELQSSAEWRDIPVVVVTGKDMTRAERDVLNGGVRRIIQKGSLDREALLAEVRGLVARATKSPTTAEGLR